MVNGELLQVHVTAYIGVKGDINFDGKADAVDASQALAYYSALSTGGNAKEVVLSQSTLVNGDSTSVFDDLAAFLGDVNEDEWSETNWRRPKAGFGGEDDRGRAIDSVDASEILYFYSLVSDINPETRPDKQTAWDIASPKRFGTWLAEQKSN